MVTVPARGLEVEKVEEIKTMLGLRLIDEDLYNCVVSTIIQQGRNESDQDGFKADGEDNDDDNEETQ